MFVLPDTDLDFIDKVIRQLYLPEYLVKETYVHFLDLRSQSTTKSNLELASYALYDYLIRQNIGKSHKEIIQGRNSLNIGTIWSF